MAPLINFSGIASGIDSSSLIKALIDRERATRITPLTNQRTTLKDTNDAFGELKTLLSNLQTAAQKLRTVNGGVIARTASSSDETVATASASNSAQTGTYDITVTQLAKNATFSFQSSLGSYTSASDAISAGSAFGDKVNITIGEGDNAESVAVAVDESTTLSDFVSSFNSQSTKAQASVVNIGTSDDPDYRIVINTNKTGTAEGAIEVTVGAVLTSRGAFDTNSKDDAANAIFTLSGISGDITRSSNSVSDLISGLTINLKSVGATKISVSHNESSTAQSIKDFVTAYNELAEYIKENDAITQEGSGDKLKNIFGPLASSSIDENALSSIRSAFSSASLSGGLVNTLSDLGITTQRDGTLAFDETVFSSALNQDAKAVAEITARLGEELGAVDGTIAQFVRFGGLLDNAVKSNEAAINGINERMARIEEQLTKQEDSLLARFSRLEALMGRLTSQQTTLASLLPR